MSFEKESFVKTLTNISINEKKYHFLEDLSFTEKSVMSFFYPLFDNDFWSKILNIYFVLKNNNFFSFWIINLFKFVNIRLNEDERLVLFSLFIFKSSYKISLSNSTLTSVNSDVFLNNVLDFYSHINIYFNLSDISISENEFKGVLFKIISYISERDKEIIESIKISVNGKTVIEYSLNLKNKINYLEEFETISNTPFKIVTIGFKKFLLGDCFFKVFEISTKNIKSNEFFEFKDNNYIFSLTQRSVYINFNDFFRVVRIVENNESFNIDRLEDLFFQKNEELQKKRLDIDLIKKENKENFLKDEFEIKMSNEDFIKNPNNFISNSLFSFFQEFLVKKNNKNFDDINSFLKNFKKISIIYLKKKKIKYYLPQDYYDYDEEDFISKKTSFINPNWDEISITELLLILKRKEISDIFDKNWKKLILFSNEELCNDNTKLVNKKMYLKIFLKICNNKTYNKYYVSVENKINVIEQETLVLQKLLSKIYLYLNFLTIKKMFLREEDPMYFPFFFDFRGRKYYRSKIGITQFKFSRYFYNYGVYCSEELNKASNPEIAPLLTKNSEILQKIKSILNLKEFPITHEIVFWCCISIGKIVVNKTKIEISTEEFLENAKNLILNPIKFKDVYDNIEFEHYKNLMLSLNENTVLKRFILKDATASFLQNLIRLLGYKNLDSLKYANLYSQNFWYDSYSYILNVWFSRNPSISPNILKYFTRKTIKKTVMTNPYSAVFLTAYQYFKDSVLEKFNYEIEIGDDVYKAFQNFYNFLENEMEKELFLNTSSTKIIDVFLELATKNKEIILESNDTKTNLIYYKIKEKTWDFIILVPEKNVKLRKTKKYKEVDSFNIDFRKISQSIRANIVHFADAILIRDIEKIYEKSLLSIHDCVLIDFLETTTFVLIANKAVKRNVFEDSLFRNENKDFFSWYIFI